MTVVVGYLAGKAGAPALHLAVATARALGTSLTVATIVPKPRLTLSRASVEAEYMRWAGQLAADSAQEAQRHLVPLADGVEVTYHEHMHRSVAGGLIEVVAQLEADVVVLGSSPSGRLGQVVIGSTANRLLHSSPVPVAISPRGYRPDSDRLTRLTCGYPGTPDSVDVVKRCVQLAKRFGVPLRVFTFAVRRATMYPPEVGVHAEDSILEAWSSQVRDTLVKLRTGGIVGDDVVLQVVTGSSWGRALEGADWQDGEILALGTSPPRGEIARVFLRPRGAKIIGHSTVPVLVLPG